MFGQCRYGVWHIDDFSTCFQHDYLQTLFPLLFCAVSLIHLGFRMVQKAFNSKYYHAYTLLNSWHHVWDFRTAEQLNGSADLPNDISSDAGGDIDDEIARNAQLALHPTTSQLNKTTIIEADKPRGQTVLVIVEFLAVLAELIIAIVALVDHLWGHNGTIAEVTGVFVWAYILLLIISRLALLRVPGASFTTLWYHTAFLYLFQWLITVLLFRSYLLHSRTGLAQSLMITNFALVTLLVAIAFSARKGNKAVELEYEGDIPPARESVASLFSLASFSWVDPIVWVGYKRPIELSDVWNLPPRDKSAAVLADYQQLKKTSKLAWHLLKYFKSGLIRQAIWAGFSGLLTFIPTLLLKSILEYIERPEDNPKSNAWFFVILLFVTGCASALADGMALWVGRKTSFRLRAVLVGEIYAKALRRRAGASTDKILGEEKSHAKKSVSAIKKRFGKKKDKKAEETQKTVQSDITSNEQVTSGTIINLMAVDTFKVAEISAYLHFLWAATPVQVVVSVYLLYKILGYSSIAGIGMMVLLLPINMFIAQQFAKIQKKILAATDARIHTTNEVLTNIRIIKYFAWEQRFMDAVDEKRTTELQHLRRRYILWASAATIWGGAPFLIAFLSFAVYTMVEKKDLIPSIAFTALSLFQILRIPLDQLADMVAHVQEAKVSVDRIEEFLSEEDTQKYKQLRHPEHEDGEPIIGFKDATFSWSTATSSDDDGSIFRMLDLNIRFKPNELNVIVGPTGSGKTSLLMALLGEMTLSRGNVYLPGGRSREDLPRDPETGLTESVAYCAQQPWLVNGTVKQNILFASTWNQKRYRDVLTTCSLLKDLEILDDGDATMVGEKGVTLSGGQKQRISLARALYSKARHVILDDVLSAVDSHTAKWIFDKALMGPLMYHRTCILVTHNAALCLPHSEFAVVLENGRVITQGTAEEVMRSGRVGPELMNSAPVSRAPSRVQSVVNAPDLERSSTDKSSSTGNMGRRASFKMNGDANGLLAGDLLEAPPVGTLKDSPTSAVLHEAKAEGRVKLSSIFMYLRSMGTWWFWLIAAIVFGLQQVSNVSTNIWVRQWANAYARTEFGISDNHEVSPVTYIRGISNWSPCVSSGSCTWNLPSFTTNSTLVNIMASGVDDTYYLWVYAVLGAIYMLITFLREAILFIGSLTASRKIHLNLMEKVSRAKFRFFDTTPLGQLMNRFSKDIENIDQEIAPVAVGVIHCLASILTIVILISVITPGFLIAGFFIAIMYFFIGRFYISSSRDLKRLESVQRSPLYQQFGETLSGMITIRAYGDERRFIRENLSHINAYNRPFIYLWATNRWLAFRVDIAGALVSFFSGVFVVLSVGKIDPGAAGLAMSYAVTFTENVLWFVRLYATNEQNMNSIERIREYLEVEQEAPKHVPEHDPPRNWPSKGVVEFVNYSTRYRSDFDLVLRNLTFKINSCEKIGVVGRTGAGKSSLALALFRALEAEEGKIVVDDVNVGLIGLQDLREAIVMVPQDPTLFSGTIRSNLDPFGLFTDEEIFTALRRVQLIGSVPNGASRPATPGNKTGTSTGINSVGSNMESSGVSTPTSAENKNIFWNLMSPVAESGSNLSQGQRQLLCLARALLKAPKVLLMDEATASIDYATDSKIQETIRELKGNTIITIAHRLKTIVDYDRVIVMEEGRVVEFGEPWELIRPRDSNGDEKRWFREMCEMSGELDALEKEAKRSWDSKRLVDDSS